MIRAARQVDQRCGRPFKKAITMKTKHSLEAADVKAILAAAEAEALANGWKVSIAVVDDGGHLLGMLRLDGASASTAHMAPGKAVTAIMGRRDRRFMRI
jgi:uncharacterized protein GlcG (DUF336 family)